MSISLNSKIIPDLPFFEIILKDQNIYMIILILILALSLTLSTIDTLINAISSLIIVDGKKILSNLKDKDIKERSNYIILFLCFLTFLYLLKDTVFYIFF